MKIITDNKVRPTLYSYELTAKERDQFDYKDDAKFEQCTYIRYLNNVYCVNDFERCIPTGPLALLGWEGVESQSYFSGVLIQTSEHDPDYVIMGRYSN